MLKKFVLKNYKNFKDEIEVDLQDVAGYQFSNDCISDDVISKMLIYGRNATGKTNLGRAFMDIVFTMLPGPRFAENGVFLNADSEEDHARFLYTFGFGEDELIYEYSRFSNEKLRDERLSINGESIFRCDFFNKEYEFDRLKLIDAETANVERYLQAVEENEAAQDMEYTLPFLRWLIGNVALKKDSALSRLSNYVRRMTMITVGSELNIRLHRVSDMFYEYLEDPDKLKDLEDFLNAMGIECELVLKKLPDGQRELYFAHDKLIPFYRNASSGTLALVNLYRRLISKLAEASFVYLDEFDAFYHYEMAEKVVQFFKKKYPHCQIIMTTHNTNLMTNRLMRPDCMFILSRRGTLTPLCHATKRELREGHNLEKMYISGEFDAYE